MRLDKFLRPEVQSFAVAMERRLRENDHLPGWKGIVPHGLLGVLARRASELKDVLESEIVDEEGNHRDRSPRRLTDHEGHQRLQVLPL